MGHCTSDIYKTVKKEHGELFKEFIVSSESLLQFRKVVRGKQQEYDAKLSSKNQSLHREVNQREQHLNGAFNEAKVNLEAQLPFGISSFQQIRKNSVENILGYNHYKQQLANTHFSIDRQVAQSKQSFHKEAQQIIAKAEQQLKIDHEKLTPFHEMAQDKKKFIYEKGVKQFDADIKNRLKALEAKYIQDLNVDGKIDQVSNSVSLEQLDNVVNQAKSHFKNEIAIIAGTNSDSNIRI